MNEQIQNFKKKLILDAAQDLFKKEGYAGVQIDKLAKNLSIGVGTIYSMFGSKEGLFLSWMFSMMEEAFQALCKNFENEKNPMLQCKFFINYKLSYYQEERALLKDYMQNNQLFLKNTARRKENPVKKIYELLSKTIDEILKIHNKSIDDSLLSAHILDNIINGYIERFAEEENIKFTEKSDEIFSIFLKTLGIEGKNNEI